MRLPVLLLPAALLAAAGPWATARVTVTVDRNAGGAATPAFRFAAVARPGSTTRPVARCTVAVVDGTMDEHCGRPALYLGKRLLPASEDDPNANFFFAEGTDGGRLRVDLGSPVAVREVDTYSWHPADRGPQVYALYAADGSAAGFDPAPRKGTDPATRGWTRVADVDTRSAGGGKPGGQYGVSIADPATGSLGTYRYLLLDVSRTESTDDFGNTFFSKLDVIADRPPATRPTTGPAAK